MKWLRWLMAGAMVLIVIIVALNFSEAQAFVDVAGHARPEWLALALILQGGTYAGEAEVWRTISCRANCPLTFGRALALSFAKLFVDQTLPTGGVAGAALAGLTLDRHGVSRHAIAAAVVLERATFLGAYALGLVAALVIGTRRHHINAAVLVSAAVFASAAMLVGVTILAVAGRPWRAPNWARRVKPIAGVLRLLRRADPTVVRRPQLIGRATMLQAVVIALDTATMMVVLRSLGSVVPFDAVFVSFMVSSVFRTIGILPGGLGTFEASSVLTLGAVGTPIPTAVSATLLFRGLSYWLPLLPGMWFARHMVRQNRKRSLSVDDSDTRAGKDDGHGELETG